tara:strand:- start:608 stop:892 length:285 start_codon:yes stop_codon:yes gene_type:complete
LQKARLLRFYNGAFTLDNLKNIKMRDFGKYLNAIEIIESKEMLDQMIVADFPHVKKEKRSNIHAKLKRKLRQENDHVLTSTEEIAKVIGGLSGR